MSLDQIVTINITTQTTAPEQANFGTPLVLGYHTNFAERTRTYAAATAAADLLTDGFAATDPIVVAVTTILSQNPKVSEVVVGRMAAGPARSIKLTPQLAELEAGVPVPMVINGNAISPVAATPTVAELTASMKSLIDALALTGVTTVDNTTDLDVNATAGNEVTIEVPRLQIERKDNTADPGIATDLTAVQNENDDWYSLVVAQESEAITNAAAAWIEAQKKTYVAVTGDDDALDSGSTTDVISDLNASSYARTAIYYHPKPHEYPNAGHVGVELPLDPGSYTMMFKTLAGVEVVTMTSNEKTNIANKRGNTYTVVQGVPITETGAVSAAGEFIDNTRFIDWLRARMQERIYARQVNLKKIPFTNFGIGIIEAEVRGQLQEGINVGGLSGDPFDADVSQDPFIVTVPDAADISFVDKASRNLTGVKFQARLAGAIHTMVITGEITV